MAKKTKSELPTQLQSAARLVRTELASRLLGAGLYAGQDQIILALAEEDGLTPGQLSMRLGVRPPTVTKTVSRLVAQGFLSREASGNDARMFHIHLTDSGREAVDSIHKALRKCERRMTKGFDKKERKLLSRLLGQLETNLDRSRDDAADEDDSDES